MGKSLKTSQRTIAAVSIASLALLNVGIMAPAAHAEGDGSGGGSTTTTTAAPLPAMPTSVTLKINKRTTPATYGKTSDGREISDAPGKPINGVKFTIKKFPEIDLTTNQGWVDANLLVEKFKADPNPETGNWTLTAKERGTKTDLVVTAPKGQGVTKATTGQGVAEFTVEDDKRGLYLVTESIDKGAKVNIVDEDEEDGSKAVDGSKVVKAAPFVVALPMTDQGTTNTEGKPSKWLSTVNVYPKNSLNDIKKSVEDAQTPGTGNNADGSQINYTIKTDVPENTTFKNYQLIDRLDALLTYLPNAEENSVVLVKPNAPTEEGKSVKLTKDDDYILVPKKMDNGSTFVTVTFTEEGLKQLNAGGVKAVKWVVPANVGDTKGKTEIPNKAWLIPDNDPSNAWDPNNPGDNPPGDPSNVVVSKYGKFVLNKQNEKGAPLNGAEFELHTCSKDSTKADLNDGNKVKVDNQSSWTSGKTLNEKGQIVDGPKGQIVIDGLQLNDFKNGAEGKTFGEANEAGQVAYEEWKDKSFYCLVETKAPNGYELLPEPIKFQITQETSTVKDSVDWTNVTSVKNVPNNGGFELPLTGGKGIFGLIALGALLVLGSIGYIFFASRRQES